MHRSSRMKLLAGFLTIIALSVIVAGSNTANAQDVAVGQAKANVLAVLVVTAEQDLAFGDVMQGVPDAVASGSADAGWFKVAGAESKEVSMYLQLPDYLWNDSTTAGGASDEDRMVVAFKDNDLTIGILAASIAGTPGAGAITDLDPHNIAERALGATPNNELHLFLGGTVFPTVDQRTGVYSADIVFTAAYTGQ